MTYAEDMFLMTSLMIILSIATMIKEHFHKTDNIICIKIFPLEQNKFFGSFFSYFYCQINQIFFIQLIDNEPKCIFAHDNSAKRFHVSVPFCIVSKYLVSQHIQ